MKFTPGINRVLVEPDAPETHMGSILISEWRQVTPNHGRVVAVGKMSGDYTAYNIGALVHWTAQANGAAFEMDGKLYYVMHIENILGEVPKATYEPEKTDVA